MPPVPMRMRLGFRAEPGQQDFGAGIGETEEAVVLGEPIAMVAEAVGKLGQRNRRGDGLRGRGSADDRGLIEN